jgi:hypothetical protein
MLNLISNLAPINMKKTRISIVHQIEKTYQRYLIENLNKLSSSEVERNKMQTMCNLFFFVSEKFKINN